MMENVKLLTKALFRSCGLDVRRTPRYQPYQWLRELDIRTVLDVGANTGQFAAQIHGLLPGTRIYSFEPLADCYTALKKNMSGAPGFTCYNFALGDKTGRQTIHRSAFSPSSSLLPMDELHKQAFPHTANVSTEEIDIRRLDDIAGGLELCDNILVKIDVQGFEDRVIMGGTRVIERASVLIVETSFEPLYRGQLLFDGIYDMLKAKGFAYGGSEEPVRDPRDGRILQCDSVFLRKVTGPAKRGS
jgi:FkbM family methyltransferase